jgi:hypothetical protein
MFLRRIPLALIGLLALVPGAVRAADEIDPRGDVETMEALLDRVVRRVSQPSAAPFFGATEASRAYRMPGYGVVFVVPPRALPPGRVGTGPSPGDPRETTPSASLTPDDPSHRAPTAEESANSVLAPGLRGARAHAARERQLQAIEAKVDALSREAERQRAEAERALAAAMQEVQLRLSVSVPGPPPPPPFQAPPLPPDGLVEPPPAPPWRFWLNTDDSNDPRSAADVVRDVKAAVSQVVEVAGSRLRSVRGDEYVVVAIDFVPQWDFGDGARADRTLVVRARKRDLVDHESGKLATEDLRKRIEYVEY